MLLVSTSFIINTSIFSLFLFIVFHLIKGYTAIFNNLHFYTWKKRKKKKKKKKKNHTKNTDFINWTKVHWHFFLFLFLFSTLVTFRFFIEIIYASSYQIYIKSFGSNIRIWSLVVLSIFYFVFVLIVMIPLVCAFCVDVTLCLQGRERFFLIQQLLLWRRRRHFKENSDASPLLTPRLKLIQINIRRERKC